MHETPLTVDIRPDGCSTTFALAGELDLASCSTLRVCFEQLDPGFSELLVDLTDVTFIDSTALSLLVMTQRDLEARGGRLVVRGACGHVRRVLEVSGVDRVLTLQA